MRRRACRNHTCIWDSTQLITFGRVYHSRSCFMRSCHTNAVSWGTTCLLFLATAHKALVKLMSVGPSGSWSNATSWVLSLAGLLCISEHTLQERSSVFLSTAICLLEAKRTIGSVETLVNAVRAGASTSLVWCSLQFHLRLISFFKRNYAIAICCSFEFKSPDFYPPNL